MDEEEAAVDGTARRQGAATETRHLETISEAGRLRENEEVTAAAVEAHLSIRTIRSMWQDSPDAQVKESCVALSKNTGPSRRSILKMDVASASS